MSKLTVFDKRGIPIERGDVVKVFHFVGARRKRHYMYKQCMGLDTFPGGAQAYVFFSHLNLDEGRDGRYHEHVGTHLPGYEIVQSIKCDHEARPRAVSKRDSIEQ